MEWFWTIGRFAGISAAIYLVIAVGLILSQWPPASPRVAAPGEGLDFDKLALDHAPAVPTFVAMRDGEKLAVRVHDGAGPLVLVLHGSGGHGGGYDWLGAELARGGAQVLVPDLRGHGQSGGASGDVAYVGQLEDDLADLIAAYRKPGQKLVLLGHSSGGGLAVRFAGGDYGHMMDGAVLLAPFLKYNAPTMRPNSGGWANVLTRRVIGLSMLNTVGIRLLNGLQVIGFTLPDSPMAETMTPAYSFRMNTSYAPRSDYAADMAALPPFQLIVGQEDEAFRAEAFEPVMAAANPAGQYHVLDGVSHLDVFLNPEVARLVAGFLKEL